MCGGKPRFPLQICFHTAEKNAAGTNRFHKVSDRGAVRDGHAGGAGRMYWAVEEAQGRGSFLQQISG